MVTAMARNGVEFGIRMSSTGDQWFTAPAPVVDGLFFPGHSAADATPDLGDSAITETAGLGGFAMAAAPAIVQFVGGTPSDALANTLEMGHVETFIRTSERTFVEYLVRPIRDSFHKAFRENLFPLSGFIRP
jgi:hypothetical protein